ncbi:MAG TPA: phosphoglycerate mutase family protein [Thermoanaerobaculia bacterium]
MIKHSLIAIAIVFSAASSNARPSPQITTIILVRHAEKAGPSGDVLLSAAGFDRAKELARVLGSAGISAIYTTPFHRVRQTAEPLATALHITPVEVETGDTYARDVVNAIMRDHKGQTVLVIGHSNTTVDVLRQLKIPNPPSITDSQYDDLFLCTISGATRKLLVLHYGAVAR